MRASVGETIRVFMVNGGPNLTSSFHPIGNVWMDAWPQGAFTNMPLHYIQTQPVPPGSAFVGHMKLPVSETIKLVDHALSRVVWKGLLAEIKVEGPDNRLSSVREKQRDFQIGHETAFGADWIAMTQEEAFQPHNTHYLWQLLYTQSNAISYSTC